jgi:hypothetical protein
MRSRLTPSISPAKRTAFVTYCMFLGLSLSHCQRTATAPEELIGHWTTSAPGYEDRYLAITITTIVFGCGAGTAEAQSVRRIEAIQEGSRTLYTVVYGPRKDEQSLLFYYDPVQGVITFRNQSHLLWKKRKPGS